ncbi:MAG TPA: hypothetical protein VHF25_05755 [Nitriliruptorales bacterium]|nr:hypothetical protein [Nitriliruptorales bacterium]
MDLTHGVAAYARRAPAGSRLGPAARRPSIWWREEPSRTARLGGARLTASDDPGHVRCTAAGAADGLHALDDLLDRMATTERMLTELRAGELAPSRYADLAGRAC